MTIAFEDFAPGQVIEGEPIGVSREELVAFAREFDPQPFHLDEEAAKRTFVGRLIGSGWQTAAFGMRCLHRDAFRGGSTMGSPGIEELRWLKPVLPGDSLHPRIEVQETRPSTSKDDRGYVRFAMTLANGQGEPVMTQAFSVIFARRGATPTPRRVALSASSEPLADPEPRMLAPLARMEIGEERDLGRHRFEADAIIAFARAYDPQDMHVDAGSAERTHFGALCASGWHTAAAWMKRLHATFARDAAFTAERGLIVPALGPSPGFKDMRWLKPVYAGDVLHYTTRLVDSRPSGSRPGWGLATHHNTAINQHGETAFAFTGSVFWQWDGQGA